MRETDGETAAETRALRHRLVFSAAALVLLLAAVTGGSFALISGFAAEGAMRSDLRRLGLQQIERTWALTTGSHRHVLTGEGAARLAAAERLAAISAELGAGHRVFSAAWVRYAPQEAGAAERLGADVEAFRAAVEVVRRAPPVSAEALLAIERIDELSADRIVRAYDLLDRRISAHMPLARAALDRTLAGLAVGGLLVSALLIAIGIRPIDRRLAEGTLLSGEAGATRTARTDPVTGLAARADMMDRLREALSRAATDRASMAVLHLDIDRFKDINETHGYAAGDRLLRMIGERIRAVIRTTDFVARIGDDDFLVILERVDPAAGAATIARRIQNELRRPVRLDKGAFRPSCSIGVVEGDLITADAGECLANAESALKQAKQIGRGLIQFYSAEMRSEREYRNRVARDLARSIDNGLIRPFFQPQVSLETGAVVGFEALARWLHPTRGVLGPGAFLDIAAQTGRGHHIARVMVEQSLDALAAWDREGFSVPRVALNFTSDQLADPGVVDQLKWEVDQRGLSPDRVAVEVLETVLVENDDDAVARNIRAMGAAGFIVELDDFGTGHAAISNIRRLEVMRVKIDRSFITGIDLDTEKSKIVAAMVNMALSLEVEVLAEGIETTGERDRLIELGCPLAQGYLFARPMPMDDVADWLRTRPDLVAAGKPLAAAG
ncbi:MAG: EAL domain-containing protein [Pseudomonadota bacterium]